MAKVKPTLGQLNLVSVDPAASIAFYRRLGVEIADAAIWRTASGTHHVSARSGEVDFELDSTAFAQVWNEGWRGRGDLKGRIVLGFRVTSREAVGVRKDCARRFGCAQVDLVGDGGGGGARQQRRRHH